MAHLNTFLPDYFIYEKPQRKNLDCIILLQTLHRRNKYLLQSLILEIKGQEAQTKVLL